MSEGSRSERFLRYSSIANPGDLIRANVAIVGVGAIGRQVALQLAAMGVRDISIIDFDTVEEANMGAQGYRPDQLEKLKVLATKDDMQAINPEARVLHFGSKFGGKTEWIQRFDTVFCCVDSMKARRTLFDMVTGDQNIVDTRMSGLNAQAYFVNCGDSKEMRKYETTLFTDEEAFPEPCTARSVFFTSNIIAGLAVSLWVVSLKRQPEYPSLALSLVDYTLDPIELKCEPVPPPASQPSEDTAPDTPQTEPEADPVMS